MCSITKKEGKGACIVINERSCKTSRYYARARKKKRIFFFGVGCCTRCWVCVQRRESTRRWRKSLWKEKWRVEYDRAVIEHRIATSCSSWWFSRSSFSQGGEEAPLTIQHIDAYSRHPSVKLLLPFLILFFYQLKMGFDDPCKRRRSRAQRITFHGWTRCIPFFQWPNG